MSPAELRKFARKQLRGLKEDVDDYERRTLDDPRYDHTPVNDVFDAMRRLIENRTLDLSPLVRADD